ncbi:MAG: hypothetical protein A3C88_00475 [Candidatus Yanofskybacteria bacterium RIFCSPHIGHO2_02_FULL_50_12]|uniref:Uncharacterized protein n=1 Tax=Candidatus Yanofskybacteria bacterium RIFCSPHIGHO2_02_FULL_50_12 TaxID=1802685 RepID=A0A1F8FUQ6_9BACT|nr:MAG: hypothetical protein A3C88_00475 [Candidatus Yanofskybacteria bacterium RIFCSPHIGHO2_02_FULL_50_12]
MRTLIHKARQQPRHIRELLAGLCTLVVVAVVVTVWFNSFERNLYALLNEPQDQETQLAIEKSQSLLGSIGSSVKDFGLAMGQLFSLFNGKDSNITINQDADEGQPYPLPVWGNR